MSLTEMMSSLMKVTEDDLALQEEHLGLQFVPFVKVLLADLLQIIHGGIPNVSLGAAALSNDTESFLGFALLLLLQLLGGLLAEKSSELLLTLGGHKSLLLGHDESVLGSVSQPPPVSTAGRDLPMYSAPM